MGDMENRTRREAEDYQVSIFIGLSDVNIIFQGSNQSPSKRN